MPNPSNKKYQGNKSKFISDCMRVTKSEGGLSVKQQLGKCYGMWRNKHPNSKDASIDLEKIIEEADKSNKPSVFLGGSCKDNKWREEIKEEFKDKSKVEISEVQEGLI